MNVSHQLLPMKQMSEFSAAVLGISGLFMILMAYLFAFYELFLVAYTALVLHCIFVAVALPTLLNTLFLEKFETNQYKILICIFSIFNALLLWGTVYELGLDTMIKYVIVLEFIPIFLILLNLYVNFWEDQGNVIAYRSHLT